MLKKQVLKKAVAWLLLVCMLCSFAPVSAFATNETSTVTIINGSDSSTDGASSSTTAPSGNGATPILPVVTYVEVATLAELESALSTGKSVRLTADIVGDVTVQQQAGVDVVIDGNGKTFTGELSVIGASSAETATLSIANVVFQAAEGNDACIGTPDRTNSGVYAQTHNVLVTGCTFKGNTATPKTAAAIRHRDGGDKNWTIVDCTVDENMHSLLQVNNVTGKLVIDNCTVNSKNGMNLNSCTNVEITNSVFDVEGYVVRSGATTGGNPDELKTFVLENNTLKNNNSGEDAVIVFRAGSVALDVSMTKNVVSGTAHFSGLTDTAVVSADANYWTTDGTTAVSAPVVAAGSTEVKVDTYYSDDTLTDLVTSVPAVDSLTGEGTVDNPYLINTIEELKWFRDDVNAGNTYDGEYVKLTADINLADEAWTPIGNATNKFLGTFDGDNHTVSNLNVSVDTNNAGLFGFASVIRNVKIHNATVSGVICVGALVGELESSVGTVDNCHVTGKIQITGENSVGGLAGKGYANIKNSSVVGDGAATSFVKGVLGSTEEGDNVGGIIGHLGEGNTLGVSNSTVKNITVIGTRKVGGIVGTTARGNDMIGCTVDGVVVESSATAEYANANASTATIGGIVGNYFGSATSGGVLQDCTVRNVTFNVGNAKSAGSLVGGDRNNNGGEPVGVDTVSGNVVDFSTVEGSTNDYLATVPVYVAEIDGVKYESLQAAIDAAADGATVTLLSNVALADGVTVPVGKTITLELNGKILSRDTEATSSTAAITNNGTLTIQDSVGGGKITAFAENPDIGDIPYYANNTITNCGTLIIKSGTIENSTGDEARAAFPIDNNSTLRDAILIIEGGTITGRGAIRQFANSTTHKNEVVIKGGTVSGTSYAVWTQNPGSTDPVASLTVEGGKVDKILLSPSANFEVAITGGTIKEVAIWSADTTNPERNPSDFISGGTFSFDVSDFCADGFKVTDNDDGTFGVIKYATNGAYVAQDTHVPGWTTIWGQLSINGTESFYIEIYAGETYLGKTTLVDTKKEILDGTNREVTWHAFLDGSDSYWNTEWTVAPICNMAPTNVKYFVDGVEVGGGAVKMSSADDLKPVVWAELRGVYKEAKIGNTYYASLADAIAAAVDGDTITLLEDVSDVDVTIKKNVTLDLGGKTITDAYIKIEAEVTVQNGSIKNTTEPYPLVVQNGGKLTVNEVAIEASKSDLAIWVREDSSLIFNSGSILATKGENNTYGKIYAIKTAKNTYVEINGGTITVDTPNATAVAIFGNYENADVVVNGGKISTSGTNYSYGINVDGDITVNGGEIVTNEKHYGYPSGVQYGKNYAITTKGNVTISGGTITTNGSSGYVVYAASSGAQSVTITGGTFTNVLTETDKTVGGNSAPNMIQSYSATITATVSNGTFSGYSADLLKSSKTDSALTVSGGTFDVAINEKYCAEGFEIKENADGTYGVVVDPAYGKVASIVYNGETTYYESFVDALNYAKANAGAKITLLDDVTIDGTWTRSGVNGTDYITAPLTINGNGKTIKVTAKIVDPNYSAFLRVTGDVTLTNLTIDLSEATIDGNWMRVISMSSGDLSVDNCTFIGNTAYTNTRGIIFGEGGVADGQTVVIKNSTFENYRYGVTDNETGATEVASVTLTGNTFNNAGAQLSASDTVVFTGNVVSGGKVSVTSYSATNELSVTATGNTLDATQVNSISAKEIDAQDGFVLPVAEANGKYYFTLAGALEDDKAGDTVAVTLLADVALTEGVTVPAGKTVTLDLNGKTVSMSVAATATTALITNNGTLTIEDSVGGGKLTFVSSSVSTSYSTTTIINNGTLTVNGGTIENTSARGGAAYAIDTYNTLVVNGGTITSANTIAIRQAQFGNYDNTVTVNGGTISGGYAGLQVHVFSNVKNTDTVITDGTFTGTYAFYTSFYNLTDSSNTEIEVEGGTFDGAVYLYNGNKDSTNLNVSITGGKFLGETYVYTKDADGNAVNVPAISGGTFTTDVSDYCADGFMVEANADGTYGIVVDPAYGKVAMIGGTYFDTLAAALAAAVDGDVITLIYNDGDDPISMAGAVYGKTVTITGTAVVDWDQNFLFVGRGGVGDGTVIFENAYLTSASNSRAYGIHVSGREKDTTNKYDGTLIIKNSEIVLDYLINKGTMTVDNSKLTVKNGFSIGGRPADETESGVDATATIDLLNGAYLTVNYHNGMGLGYEAIGVMNVTGGSTFECTQDFLVTAKGTLNVDGGNLIVAGKLTNNGTVTVEDTSLTDITIEGAGTTYFAGEVNFYGTNSVVTTGANNGNQTILGSFDLIVNKGATLLISRFVLGYNRNITVYGEIEDAHSFDPTDKTPSLKFNHTSGVSVGGNGTGNLTVVDAYIELGNSSWKNAQGTYTWTFTNSYVSATSFTNCTARYSDDASWTVTFDDSVLAAKNYIKNGVGATYNFTNGSVATTGSLAIRGEMNIDATSSVTVTAQQNNGAAGNLDEHGDVTGTLNIAGTLVIQTNISDKAPAFEFLGGTLNVSAGATFDLGTKKMTFDASSTLTSAGNVTGQIDVADGATVAISGGTYTQDLSEWCEFGYLTKDNGDGTYTFAEDPTVAFVANYAEFNDAHNDSEVKTIVLTDDIYLTGKFTITKSITIDGNGHSIIADANAVWYETGKAPLYLKSYKIHLIGVNSDNVTLKNVVLDCNNNAAGINVYCAQNVVFDSVSIINATKGMAGLTVNGSTLTVKNQLTILGNATAIDIDLGSGVTSSLGVTAEEGTIFDLGDKTVKFNSAANNDLTGAVNATGDPYFAAMDNANFYTKTQINNRTTAYSNGLTLLTDVTLTNDLKVKGTLNLNGNSLTLAEGKTIKSTGNLEITGDGTVNANIVLDSLTKTLTGPEGMNVTTTVANAKVVYADGVYSVVAYAAKIGDELYETLAEALAAVGAGDVVIELLTDATLDYNARDAFGTADTTSITINGNGKTLTLNQKNSDWASIGMANASGKLVLNNMTIEKIGYGDTSGAWNTHAIIFKCALEMNNVTVNNSMAVENGASLNNVTINEAGDFYALWIDANGQSVEIEQSTISAPNGRGIKIGDQYVSNVASVDLTVSETKFNTAKKAAVLVTSTAGADITATNVDITNVAADNQNFAWVDEDRAENFGNVTVNDTPAYVEGLENFVAQLTDSNGKVLGYYKSLIDAIAAAQAGETIVLLSDIALTETLVIDKEGTITIDGNGFKITQATGYTDKQNALIMLGNSAWGDAETATHNYTFKNVVFDGITSDYSIIRAQGVTLTMDGCEITNFTSPKRATVVRLDYTEATIKNSKFENNVGGMVVVHNYNADPSQTKLNIDNCVFSNNEVNLNAAVVYYVTGSGCTITDSEFVGNDINSAGNAATLYLGFMENCVVTGNLFQDNDATTTGTTARVAGAIFFGYEAEITGNAFVNNTASNANGDTLGQICTSTYYGGTIDLGGNHWGGEAPVYGKDYTVQHQDGDADFELNTYAPDYTTDANGNVVIDGNNLTEFNYVAKVGKFSYETLSEAFAAAQAGDTVVIFAGTYAQGLTVNKDITVVGETDAEGNNLVTFNGQLSITADGATVKNLNFSNPTGSAGKITAKDVLVEGCTVVGYNGFRYCYTSGTVTFKDSTITGDVYGIHFDGSAGGNVVIDNCVITGWTSFARTVEKVTMTDTTFEEGNYNYVRFYQSAEITGCTFNEKMAVDISDSVKAEVVVKDCTVENGSVEDLFEGADIVNSDITVDDALLVRVAKIGDTYYATLADAINAAENGSVITVIADLTVTGTMAFGNYNALLVVSGKTVTVDLNGKTVSAAGSETLYAFFATANNGHLTLKDSVGGGRVDLDTAFALLFNYDANSSIIVESGSYELTNATNALVQNNGSLEIRGGTFTLGNAASKPVFAGNSKATVTGGTYNANIASQANIPEAYALKNMGDGTYTIVDAVASVNGVGYATLAEAFAAAQNGNEVKILVAGTYSLTGITGKSITVTGTVNGVVFDNIGEFNMGGASVTFNNVTFDYYPNVNYTGLAHSGNLVYNNCTFNGQVFLYGTSEIFNDCIFNQNSKDAYNVWTYGAKKVEFNRCTFNSAGKSVLIYSEDKTLFNDVSVSKSTFNASETVAGKAAIEMDSSLTAGIKLTIDEETTATGFDTNTVSGNDLWNNKKGNNTDANNDITVSVGGDTVLEPLVFVAKIGEIGYTTLAEAIAAATAGQTVTVVSDVTISEMIKINTAITLDLGTYTVTSTANKAFEIHANTTIKNGTIVAAQRCVDTRVAVELTLTDVTLRTTGSGNTQPLTIGGYEHGTKVTLTGVTINAGTAGYGIIAFVQTELNITDSNVSGYGAVYMKAGSENSVVNVVGSALTSCVNIETENFAAIVLETNNIQVTVDENSEINAVNGAAILFSEHAPNGATAGTSIQLDATVNAKRMMIHFASEATVTTTIATVADQLIAEGYIVEENAGVWSVEEAGVASVEINGTIKNFTDLQEAIDYLDEEGVAGTIKLVANTKDSSIVLYENITLDLNGYTLETRHFVAFKDAYVVDTAKSGLIKCEMDRVIIESELNNRAGYIPVYDEAAGGYRMANSQVTAHALFEENNKLIYDSAFNLGSAFRGLVTDLNNEDNLTVVVRLVWTKTAEDGTVNSFYEDIILNEELVSSVVEAHGQKSFRITVTGYENYENLTFQTIVMSGTDAISRSAVMAVADVTVSE